MRVCPSVVAMLAMATVSACNGPSDQARPAPSPLSSAAMAAVRAHQAATPSVAPGPVKSKKPVWEIVATSGRGMRYVYVPPRYIKDRAVIADALHSAATLPPEGPVEVDIFDDRANTPTGPPPFTDRQMAHWRAQYNRNPNTGFEKFAWIKARGDDVTLTPDSIRPAAAPR